MSLSQENAPKNSPKNTDAEKAVSEAVKEALLLAIKLPFEKIQKSTNLFDEGLDSIAFIEVIQSAETTLGIQLTDQELASFEKVTFEALVEILGAKFSEKSTLRETKSTTALP